MKVLQDFGYSASNGSETFYDYFFNKVGIGADSNAPFTKFIELVIDCFYNNSEELTNLLYDGVLNHKVADNLLDDELRVNWLNKLGADLGLPNEEGVLGGYHSSLSNLLLPNEYKVYLYLSNCRLRTVEDWRVHFDKCFLTEENDDISTRIEYEDNNLVLVNSIYDNQEYRAFMNACFNYFKKKNLIWDL